MSELNQDPLKDIPVVDKPKETPTNVGPTVSVETPKLFAGKYKSVEEMENAYLDAQKVISAQGQENSAIREQLEVNSSEIENLKSTPPPASTGIKTPEQASDEFLRDPMGFLKTVITEEMKPLAQGVLDTGSKLADVNTYVHLGEEDRINYRKWEREIAGKIESLNMNGYDPKTPLRAFNMVKADKLLAERENLQNQVDKNNQIRKEQNSRAVGIGSGVASVTATKKPEDMTMEELKKFIESGGQ